MLGKRPRRLRGQGLDAARAGECGAARRCSSGVEQLTCNQQVVGSTPTIGSTRDRGQRGEVPEWPKGADCKSAGDSLRRFESSPLHFEAMGSRDSMTCGSSSGGRARAFQARGRGFDSRDRKSTRLNSSHANISYAVFCLKKKKQIIKKRL